jgi:hypothetical protein
MRRPRFLDDLAVVPEHNRVPLALCPALAETAFATASLFATLRGGRPPQLRVADYLVESRQPDANERELLEITDTTPVRLDLGEQAVQPVPAPGGLRRGAVGRLPGWWRSEGADQLRAADGSAYLVAAGPGAAASKTRCS